MVAAAKKRRGGNKHRHAQDKPPHDDAAPGSGAVRRSEPAVEDDEDMDFCQRFFGDALFSNLNVALLFLTATFLPMIVWIPHFISEYRRLRHIQLLEEQRQVRMQKARLEVQSTQQQHSAAASPPGPGDGYDGGHGGAPPDEGITILQDSLTPVNTKSTIHFPDPDVLRHPYRHPAPPAGPAATVLPTLCPDGVTRGYDNWFLLRDAVAEANAIAAEEFLRRNEYLVRAAVNASAAPPPAYRPPDPFVICPGAVLNQKSPYRGVLSPRRWAAALAALLPGAPPRRPAPRARGRLSPIFVNAEDLVVECDMCTVDLPGTHFSFGPHAKNVLLRGLTFRGATASSLTFHHHGADVGLEDCYWLYNSGGLVSNHRHGPYANVNSHEGLMSHPPGGTTMAGAVADLNSTSTVAFYRCVIDDVKQTKRTTTGAGVANVPGMNPPAGHHVGMNQGNGGGVVSSSLTIRN